jgi:putative membrane protein
MPWLQPREQAGMAAARGGANGLLTRNALDFARWLREGRLPAPLAAEVDRTLAALASVQAGCERIATTPIPFAYTLLLHRTAWLYCLLLPFGLVDLIGVMTPVVVAIVTYTFFGLDALGDEIEQPFGMRPHHLPLDRAVPDDRDRPAGGRGRTPASGAARARRRGAALMRRPAARPQRRARRPR